MNNKYDGKKIELFNETKKHDWQKYFLVTRTGQTSTVLICDKALYK